MIAAQIITTRIKKRTVEKIGLARTISTDCIIFVLFGTIKAYQ